MTFRRVSARDGFSAEQGSSGDSTDPYDVFCSTVILRQVAQWLPLVSGTVLDVSLPLADARGPDDYLISDVARTAGHRVITVARSPAWTPERSQSGHHLVLADPRSLDWVRSSSVDAVIAEGGALSDCLAAEDTVRDVARVLQPGGRFLASADSLVIGLSRLAEQHRWPELADAPAADVVLVPDPHRAGAFTRCFSPEDLRELFTEAGLEVEWIRPRTMLPATAVRQTLAADPGALGDLVMSELSLADAHQDEAHGASQVISGVKPR